MVLNNLLKILIEMLDERADKDETFDLLPYLRRFGLDVITGSPQ